MEIHKFLPFPNEIQLSPSCRRRRRHYHHWYCRIRLSRCRLGHEHTKTEIINCKKRSTKNCVVDLYNFIFISICLPFCGWFFLTSTSFLHEAAMYWYDIEVVAEKVVKTKGNFFFLQTKIELNTRSWNYNKRTLLLLKWGIFLMCVCRLIVVSKRASQQVTMCVCELVWSKTISMS